MPDYDNGDDCIDWDDDTDHEALLDYDDWDDHEGADDCPLCGGVGSTLGVLGRLCWHRCTNCGADYSQSA